MSSTTIWRASSRPPDDLEPDGARWKANSKGCAKINLHFQVLRRLSGKARKFRNIEIFQVFRNTARQDASALKNVKLCPSTNGQFARYRRCAKNSILGISTIGLRLNFSRALISTKFAYFWMDTKLFLREPQGPTTLIFSPKGPPNSGENAGSL
jgi:hypothetical protein